MVTTPLNTPLNSMLDRMVTLSRAMDQAFVNNTDSLGKNSAQPLWVPELDAWETESAYVAAKADAVVRLRTTIIAATAARMKNSTSIPRTLRESRGTPAQRRRFG